MTMQQVHKGLEGVYVAESSLSLIDTENNKLYYVGYDVTELIEKSSYEEVCYLLLNQRLPNKEEYQKFIEELRSQSVLSDEQVENVKLVANKVDVINALAAFILLSYKGEVGSEAIKPENSLSHAIRLIAQTAPAVAAIARARKGLEVVRTRRDLSHAANFLYILHNQVPDQRDAKLIDIILILHAEHGLPASTFGTLVTASTLSDIYSSVVSGLLTLKGPLHGGASEAAHRQLLEIGSPDNVESWFKKALEQKRRIMGFGHRIYKQYDPRARVVKELAGEVAKRKGGKVKEMYETALKLEELALKELAPRGIFPNVDFWTPIIYTAVGLDIEYYTALFAASRVAGWVAHVIEYWRDNRLIRPVHLYTGEVGKKFVPLEER